ncbi:MAG TPA: hypothetical protein VE631_06395 [Alphaproteobacteria bacterium]|nr:hypothetical protein [Alphaproteobacteria bacterium]
MKAGERSGGEGYDRIRGMDPRANWLLGPGRGDFLIEGEETLIPLIANLRSEDAAAAFARLAESERDSKESIPSLLVPTVYQAKKLSQAGTSMTVFAKPALLERLAGDEALAALREADKRITLGVPVPGASTLAWRTGHDKAIGETQPLAPPAGGWPPGTVVMGVIDDGIAFAHERFRNLAGTRVQCFLRQDPVLEICKETQAGTIGIDSLLDRSAIAGHVDEDELYRLAGFIRFDRYDHKAAAWRIAHGTHVLDCAAGAPLDADVRNRPIVAVQLPNAVTEDTSGASLDPWLLLALDYILASADRLAGGGPALPVVVNFSYGSIAGPHDGTSDLEWQLEAAIAQRQAAPLRIVLPAGNSHLSRCHAVVEFSRPGETVELPWRVQPDDRTATSLEIWLPHVAGAQPQSRLEVSIVSPGGDATTFLGEVDGAGAILQDNGLVVCQVDYNFVPAPTARGCFTIAMQPTFRLEPAAQVGGAPAVAPTGVWTVRLRNRRLHRGEVVHAWIQRDDSVYGYHRRGRQSYFDDPRYPRFDEQGRPIYDDAAVMPSVVKRVGLVNALATGRQTLVAGGFEGRALTVAPYSAGGPIIERGGGRPDPGLRKPDALLVSDDSAVHSGILAAGTRSGSTVAMGGTSVSAPRLARLLADSLAQGQAADRSTVQTLAEQSEAALPGWKPPLPPARSGWGRLTSPPPRPLPRYWT